jgi:RNA recognition motif-containing protein
MVRGIYQLSENEVWECLDKIAKVKDVRRIKDRFTGDFKDFAFVEFVTESEADFVVDLSLKTTIRISGRPVTVCKSKKKRAENEVPDPFEEKTASKTESTEKFRNCEANAL